MSEKLENRLRIGVLCLVGAIVVMIIVLLNVNSQYNQNDHLLEQGRLPVYVSPPGPGETASNQTDTQSGTANEGSVEATEPVPVMVNKQDYKEYTYDQIASACKTKKNIQIKKTVTIYSVLEVSSSIIYDVADEDGNYYSLVDSSRSGIKYKTKQVIRL